MCCDQHNGRSIHYVRHESSRQSLEEERDRAGKAGEEGTDATAECKETEKKRAGGEE